VLAALHRGDAAHPPSGGVINDYHDEAGSLKARKNIESMTDEEKARFRAAVQRMRSLDAYTQDERSFGYWGRLHGNNCQHAWEEFLTWHRAYLYFFEQQLQDVDPAVTLPYWDWTQYDQDWQIGTVDSGVIPADYQCWLDAEALDGLKGQIPDDWMARLKTLGTTRFGSANRLFAAAGIAYVPLLDPVTFQPAPANNPTQAVMDALQRVNPLWHRLRWPGPNNPSPEVSPFFQAYPTPGDIDRILDLTDFFQFGSGPDSNHFFGALENVHNLMHNFSGGINPFWESALSSLPSTSPYDPQNRWEPQYGDMVSAGVTAFDPIFWAHHSNVDRLWAEWQKRHPGTSPDNLDSSLSPWAMTVADTMSTSRMGYEYLRSAHLFETNSDVAFTRFRSAPAGVSAQVLTTYRRAEIRLHRVKFSVHGGCFIRVFLNQPDASPQTSIANNDHYVGQLSLFSGYCVGGPGHCEPPPDERRKFDLRPRHRKTPANFRIDATETVRRLVAQGEKDLHITLVVLDLNGRPKDKALWMKAVSLVFVD
jgi:tyrosinase